MFKRIQLAQDGVTDAKPLVKLKLTVSASPRNGSLNQSGITRSAPL